MDIAAWLRSLGLEGYHVTTGSRHIVRQVTVDEQTLDRVAEALGIPLAERQQFISDTESIHIYRGTREAPGAPPAPPTPPASAASRRSRQRK